MAEILIKIDEIGAQGDGSGVHKDKPVYVPKTAPGDTIRARIEHENADSFNARLLAVETPGPERAAPPCPHYERCGGCSLQHVTEDFYRGWKIEKVKSALERAGVKVKHYAGPVFLPATTRRRTTLAAFRNGKDLRLGYFEDRSHNIVNISQCPVLEPELQKKISLLREFLPALLPDRMAADIMLQNADGLLDMVLTGKLREKGDFSLEQAEAMGAMAEKLDIARISARDREQAAAEIILTRKPVTKRFGPISVALPPGAFLQASLQGEQALMRIVREHAAGAKHAADLFSGCGTLTGALLEGGVKTDAFDGDKEAAAALGKAWHPGLKAKQRDLFRQPLTPEELVPYDAAVFDPPRAGAKAQAEMLAKSSVKRVIGVSCNPSSFARDARILQEGGYSLEDVTAVDQFVWSAHVEIVGLFKRG